MGKNMEDESVERMLERYQQGLLTKEELDDFLEIQRQEVKSSNTHSARDVTLVGL